MHKTTKRRTQIEIETHETMVIRAVGRHLPILCETCGADVSRHVEAGQMYLAQNGRSAALICDSSIDGAGEV